jgi:hypothetical protein
MINLIYKTIEESMRATKISLEIEELVSQKAFISLNELTMYLKNIVEISEIEEPYDDEDMIIIQFKYKNDLFRAIIIGEGNEYEITGFCCCNENILKTISDQFEYKLKNIIKDIIKEGNI